MQEHHLVGLDYLAEVTTLLQRVRHAHPTSGLFEAADVQWWWRLQRPTDDLPQLFWVDDEGRPEAAAITTHWGDWVAFNPMVMPDARQDWVAHVVGRGLEHAAATGIDEVELEIGRTSDAMRKLLGDHGFVKKEEGIVESWLAADARPSISPLHDGYRLATRVETAHRPHHMIDRSGPDVDERLRQTSLYRQDLDLLILDDDDNRVAHGLFWYDPVTSTGLVEPMRTQDGHQGRGLARHVLTAGIDRLAEAGAERIKICFEPGNAGAKGLYLSAGFEPVRQTDVFSGQTSTEAR